MKRFALIGVIIVFIVALVFLNRGISQNAGTDSDDDSQSSQSAQKTPTPPATSKEAQSATSLQPEQIIGDPTKAKYVIRVGWIYNSGNQGDSTALADALKPIQQAATASHGQIAAQIVDLDVPVSERSQEAQSVTQSGVIITGTAPGSKTIQLDGNPGEGAVVDKRISQVVSTLH